MGNFEFFRIKDKFYSRINIEINRYLLLQKPKCRTIRRRNYQILPTVIIKIKRCGIIQRFINNRIILWFLFFLNGNFRCLNPLFMQYCKSGFSGFKKTILWKWWFNNSTFCNKKLIRNITNNIDTGIFRNKNNSWIANIDLSNRILKTKTDHKKHLITDVFYDPKCIYRNIHHLCFCGTKVLTWLNFD
mgnify:FL=1